MKNKLQNLAARGRRFRNVALVTAAGTLAVVGDASAQVSGPLDLSTAGTTIAGYIEEAAQWGIPIMLGLFGLGLVVRAFKKVAH